MSATIDLSYLGIKVDAFLWEDLVRRFAVEEHHEGEFIAKRFMEILGADSSNTDDLALADALDLIRFQFRGRFKKDLIEKYRTGSEFQSQGDADQVFDLAFRTAEGLSMKAMDSSTYSVGLMLRIELYFWVTLQAVRNERGEYMDRRHRGADVRLGDSLDLLEIDFRSILDA